MMASVAYYAVCSKGFNVATPLGATSRTLRVTRMRPCSCAVAASKPSMSGKGSGTLLSAQRLAMGVVIGRILSWNEDSRLWSFSASRLACVASRRRSRAMPYWSSPITSTERNSAS